MLTIIIYINLFYFQISIIKEENSFLFKMKKMGTTVMNGNVLENVDSVIFTKSMKVKGTQIHLKKGENVKILDCQMIQ